MYKQNTAAPIFFALVNATTGGVLTGATVTVKRTIDGGSQAGASGSVTELGNGQYVFNAANADLNCTQAVGFLLTASGAIPVHICLAPDSKLVSGLQDASVASIQSGLATSSGLTTALASLQTHGDSTWSTATGFALASIWTSGLASTISTNLDTNVGSRAPSNTALSTATWTSGLASTIATNLDTNVGSRAPSSTALSTANWTGTRAGYLDNLSAGAMATAASVANITNNTFIGSSIPQILGLPATGSTTVNVTLVFNGATGSPADIDASALPTVSLVNNAGTDVSSRLSSWTHVTTGEYSCNYTNTSTDAVDDLHWLISGTVSGNVRRLVATTQIVENPASTFTSTDRTALTAIVDWLPSHTPNVDSSGNVSLAQAFPANFAALGIGSGGHLDQVDTLTGHTPQSGDNFVRFGAPAGASVSADVAANYSRLGAPAGASIAADIAAEYARMGAPSGASMSADIAAATAAAISANSAGQTVMSSTSLLVARIPGTIQPQSGDTYALVGAGGVGLSALGDVRLANLDAAISTRAVAFDTYQPNGRNTVDAILRALLAVAANNSQLDGSGMDYLDTDGTTVVVTVGGYINGVRTGSVIHV